MNKKFRKIKPYTNRWYNLAGIEARDAVGVMYPCQKCGYPVIKGYICSRCKDVNPSEGEFKNG